MFSDDGLKTIKTAIGHLTYTKKGTTYTDFGVLAQFLIAGYIAGSTIEGNEIIGGTITGSRFNNGNGTFSVDEMGVLSATKGRIGCDKNGNGGFIIDANKLYSGKDSPSSNENGVYLGTDGIALGANNVFKVTNDGALTATSGHIGGASIVKNAICSDNGNWSINSDGTATFKNVTITGNSTFGSAVSNPFSGTTIPHIELLAANYIKVNYLDAMNANINNLFANEAQLGDLIATKASITDLNAVVARIGTLETTTITSKEVNAKFMKVEDYIKAGKIRADRIEVNSLEIGANQITGTIALWIPQDFHSTTITYVDENGGTHTQRVLTGVSVTRHAHVVRTGE